jgi:hypothetical protein
MASVSAISLAQTDGASVACSDGGRVRLERRPVTRFSLSVIPEEELQGSFADEGRSGGF